MVPFSLFGWMSGEEPDAEVWVRLFQRQAPPPSVAVLADFLEATFPGYGPRKLEAAERLMFLTRNMAFMKSHELQWVRLASGGDDNEIRGFYLTAERTGRESELIDWRQFPDTVPMREKGQRFGLIVEVMDQRLVV